MPTLISRRSHSQVQALRQIRDGKDKSALFCEGLNLVEELFRSGLSAQGVYFSSDREDWVEALLKKYQKEATLRVQLAPDVMEFVSDVSSPPGVIAVAKRPHLARPPDESKLEGNLLLVLNEIKLPQNVGSLLRTAEAAGVDEVWAVENTADAYSPKALRGSVGSAFRLKIRQGLKLADVLRLLNSKGFKTVAATQKGETPYTEFDWTGSVALVMGSENQGLSDSSLPLFNKTIQIPMSGRVESLNVGVAAAVCLFKAAEQRSGASVKREPS